MSTSLTADDKIEALVGLVLQAVDQRLTVVREELVELSNAVVRRNSDLNDQIVECREMISSLAARPGPNASAEPGAVAGSNPDADSAANQLLQAANVLTERVMFLESRVNQYTNDRVAELRNAFEQALQPNPPAVSGSGGALSPLPHLPGGTGQPGSLAPASSRSAPSNPVKPAAAIPSDATPADATPAAAAIPAAAIPAARVPAAPASAAPGPAAHAPAPLGEFDIDAFTAQFNARLSALVERAIEA